MSKLLRIFLHLALALFSTRVWSGEEIVRNWLLYSAKLASGSFQSKLPSSGIINIDGTNYRYTAWVEVGADSWFLNSGHHSSGDNGGIYGSTPSPKHESLPDLRHPDHNRGGGQGPTLMPTPQPYGRGTEWGGASPEEIRRWKGLGNKSSLASYRNFIAQTLQHRQTLGESVRKLWLEQPQVAALSASLKNPQVAEAPFSELQKLNDQLPRFINEVSKWRAEAAAFATLPERKALSEYWTSRMRETYINSNGLLKAFGDTRQYQIPPDTFQSIVSSRALNQILLAEKTLERAIVERNLKVQNHAEILPIVQKFLKNTDQISSAIIAANNGGLTLEDSQIEEVANGYQKLGEDIQENPSSFEKFLQDFEKDTPLLPSVPQLAQWQSLQRVLREGPGSQSVQNTQALSESLLRESSLNDHNRAAVEAALKLVKFAKYAQVKLDTESATSAVNLSHDLLAAHGPAMLSLGKGINSFGKLGSLADPQTASGLNELSRLLLESENGDPSLSVGAKLNNLVDIVHATQGNFYLPENSRAGLELRDSFMRLGHAVGELQIESSKLSENDRITAQHEYKKLFTNLGNALVYADKLALSDEVAARVLIGQLHPIVDTSINIANGFVKSGKEFLGHMLALSEVVNQAVTTALTQDPRLTLQQVENGLQKLWTTPLGPLFCNAIDRIAQESSDTLLYGTKKEREELIGQATFEVAGAMFGEYALRSMGLAARTMSGASIIERSTRLALEGAAARVEIKNLVKVGTITPEIAATVEKLSREAPELVAQAFTEGTPAKSLLQIAEESARNPNFLNGISENVRITRNVALEIEPHLKTLRELDPKVQVGMRGSVVQNYRMKKDFDLLAQNGINEGKNLVVKPFDGIGYDIDVFIVSDEISSRFPQGLPFKGSKDDFVPELGLIEEAVNSRLRQNPTFKAMDEGGMSFRVFTRKEAEKFFKMEKVNVYEKIPINGKEVLNPSEKRSIEYYFIGGEKP